MESLHKSFSGRISKLLFCCDVLLGFTRASVYVCWGTNIVYICCAHLIHYLSYTFFFFLQQINYNFSKHGVKRHLYKL